MQVFQMGTYCVVPHFKVSLAIIYWTEKVLDVFFGKLRLDLNLMNKGLLKIFTTFNFYSLCYSFSTNTLYFSLLLIYLSCIIQAINQNVTVLFSSFSSSFKNPWLIVWFVLFTHNTKFFPSSFFFSFSAILTASTKSEIWKNINKLNF